MRGDVRQRAGPPRGRPRTAESSAALGIHYACSLCPEVTLAAVHGTREGLSRVHCCPDAPVERESVTSIFSRQSHPLHLYGDEPCRVSNSPEGVGINVRP